MKPEIKEIIKKQLKENGLEIAEETAMLAAKVLFSSLSDIVKVTENKYDDLLIPILAVIEPKIYELIDNINKADNE